MRTLETLFCLFCAFKISSSLLNPKLISLAINGIIEGHYTTLSARTPGKFDVVYFGSAGDRNIRIVEHLLKVKNESTTISLHHGGIKEGSWNNDMKISSILIFDSLQRFKDTNIGWLTDKHLHSHHLVYAPDLTIAEVLKKVDNGYLIDYSSFLVHETKKSIELMSVFMFTPQACEKSQPKVINRFEVNNMKWEKIDFFPKKHENLFGCSLEIESEDYAKDYRLVEIFKIMATKMNYVGKESFGRPFEFYHLHLYQIDKLHDDGEYIVTYPHGLDQIQIAIAPGEPYSDLSRMFMMFSLELWIAIAVTLLIGLGAIQVINLMHKDIQNFIFGRNIQSPTMNLISIFLVGGQFKVILCILCYKL